QAFQTEEIRSEQELGHRTLALRAAVDLLDDDAWLALATQQVHAARDIGALTVLPLALTYLGLLRTYQGDFDGAAGLLEEADGSRGGTGNANVGSSGFLLAAYRGANALTRRPLEDVVRDATARGEGLTVSSLEYATAVLQNGLGRYDAALTAAQGLTAR